MHSRFDRFDMLIKATSSYVLTIHLIGLPSAGVKTNELITNHVHMRGFIHASCNISYDQPVKNINCSWQPYALQGAIRNCDDAGA